MRHHVRRRRHAQHQLLQLEDALRRQHLAQRRAVAGRHLVDDLDLLVRRRIADVDLEHEAIELRLGQRVGALLLDGILRGEDQKRQRQRVGLPAGRDAVLLHRLQQRRLRLGRRAVHLVGQHDVREDRPAHEAEDAAAGGAILLQHVGAGDVGRHQVGRELDPPERQRQRVGQRLDEQRLGQARHADEQAVPAREQRHQQMVDDLLLAHDALADLGHQGAARGGDLADGIEIALGGGRRNRDGEGQGRGSGVGDMPGQNAMRRGAWLRSTVEFPAGGPGGSARVGREPSSRE